MLLPHHHQFVASYASYVGCITPTAEQLLRCKVSTSTHITIVFKFVLIPFILKNSPFTLFSLEMASVSSSKVSYHMLIPENASDDDGERVSLRPKRWSRFSRIPIRKRLRLKIPSWRSIWRKRVSLVFAKVMKRFTEGHVQFGDLFAGNYLFTQVNPKPLKFLEKEYSLSKIA
ncbi:hypothetical protein RIF29_19484 [Crotalaria pallida]|uniref:Uncharacterized protein n=1 Tax=Crotalaria pallida TaxID=3830 RepID=A0AAN9I5I8_CROPI